MYRQPLIQFRGHCCTSVVPFPFEVPEELKDEAAVVSCFGRALLPKWKLHFLLNPLLSLVLSSSFNVRPFEEWVGPPRSGPLTPLQRGLGLCRSGSGEPCHGGVLSATGLGGLLPDLHTGLAPRVCRSRRVRSFIQRSLFRQQSGHTPPHSKLSGSHGDGGRLGVKSRGDALPCPACITTTDTSEGRTWL